jgi:penicillin V acylase-like amidase (Ntn superfamily)
MHYAIHDRTGGAIVVEFTDGKKNVYDNPVNVLANGPDFPWHITNLKNYTFSNVDKNFGELGKLKIEAVDSGIALTGLPSAQTSPGRFVKAAFYAHYVNQGNSPDEAILRLAHIMNNFDRPEGLTIDGPGGMGDGPHDKALSSEVTDYMVMKDLTRNRTYVRSIDSLNWTLIEMDQLKGIKEVKSASIYQIDHLSSFAF